MTVAPGSTEVDADSAAEPICPESCLTAAPGELFVVLAGCSTTNPFQRWDVLPVSGDLHTIRSVGVTAELDVDICLTVGVPQAGAAPTLNPCDQSPSQRWSLVEVPGAPADFLISLGGLNLEAGTPATSVVMAAPSGGPLQRWRVAP